MKTFNLGIVGTCCSADPAALIVNERNSNVQPVLIAYQGRTSPLSSATGPLKAGEFDWIDSNTAGANWASRMVSDEVHKRQWDRIYQVADLLNVLVIDFVAAVAFPYIEFYDDNRIFLQSPEWDQNVFIHTGKTKQSWFWEHDLAKASETFVQFVCTIWKASPACVVVVHVPKPSYASGAAFHTREVANHIETLEIFSHRVYSCLRKLSASVQLVESAGLADPVHRSGKGPFNYTEESMRKIRDAFDAAWMPFL